MAPSSAANVDVAYSPPGSPVSPHKEVKRSDPDNKPQPESNQLPDGTPLGESIETLIDQWQKCISELQHLQQIADAASRPVRGLSALLKVQQRALDKVVQKHRSPDGSTISAAQFFGIRSCCWDDRWAVVKKCRGLVAINKEFPRSPRLPVAPDAGWLAYKDQPFQEKTVLVDAVVDSGATWIKFISINPRTLEYQVMAEGWASEPEDSSDGEGEADADDGLIHTEFANTVKKIVLAARWNHCHRLHLILPSLQEGKSEVVDRMIRFIRQKIGGEDVMVEVTCANSSFLTDAPPAVDVAITALIQERDPLVAEDCARLTDMVNLDPSVLVALVTDLHHGPVPLQPASQQKIIVKAIEDHETDNNDLVPRQEILAKVLYPALRGRKLVCTKFAAAYFRKLISAISTRSEEVRASFVLPPADASDSKGPSTHAELLQEFQKWSSVPVPSDLQFPVQIVPDVTLSDIEILIANGQLPAIARGVAADLSPLNRSVYCYGWAHRLTTVTGHRGIERQIQLAVARHWTRSDDESAVLPPPDVWHRHLGGYLIHRDKPRDWRMFLEDSEEVPEELVRWTYPWTTWGRGISTYGLPDTKTWEGVGHAEKTGYGRRMSGREARLNPRKTKQEEDENEEPEQS